MEGGVDPIEEGIEPGDLVFVLRETRHRTFRRLTGDSPHLTCDVTVGGRGFFGGIRGWVLGVGMDSLPLVCRTRRRITQPRWYILALQTNITGRVSLCVI